MTKLDRLPPLVAAPPPEHADAVATVRAGPPFTCVLHDDPAVRAAMLQAVLDSVADLETRFVHVGNPLRSPLTIERLFMQAVGPEADVRLQRDGAALTRTLATPVGDEGRLILVVEQAETLDQEALETLQAMAPSFAKVTPRVQMIFSGPAAFGALLGTNVATAPTPPAPEPKPTPAEPAPNQAEPRPAPPAASAPAASRPRRRRTWSTAIAASVLLLLACAAAALAWRTHPDLLARFGLGGPAPAEAAPAAPPRAPAALAPPTANAAEEVGMLRREFDDFVAKRPDAADLTQAQKDGLFQEFLARRRPAR